MVLKGEHQNLIGLKFGRLTVVKYHSKDVKGHTNFWECICECGKAVITRESTLKKGVTTSCGCYNLEKLKERATTHGLSKHRLYRIYKLMKQRCYDKNQKRYKDYGGRGIIICDEWLKDFKKFYDWSMENGYEKNLTIDRIDVNGNYNPENCRWATYFEQGNNKRNNHLVTFRGETKTISEWSKELHGNFNLVYRRLKRGWSLEEALTTPNRERNRKGCIHGRKPKLK